MIDYETRCHRCGVLQPLSNYTPNNTRVSGYYEVCKTCRASEARERRAVASVRKPERPRAGTSRETKGPRLRW